MHHRPASPLAQNPDWWSESWGNTDWLETLFSTPLEVHAFLLGAFVGVTIVSLTLRQGERTTFALVLVIFLFTFGALETTVFCSSGFVGCEHVRLKPWYFLGGFLAAYLGSEGLKTRYTAYSIGGRPDESAAGVGVTNSIGTPLAGVVVFVLLPFAIYSFVSPTPVQPLSGLAIVGGFFGSTIGLAAFRWARAPPGDERGFVESLASILVRDRDESALVIAYGTVLGLGYPRLFWELGSLRGSGGYLLGSIKWARNGLPSVVVYVSVFFAGVLVYWTVVRRDDRLSRNRFAALVLAFVTYAFCLFLATGYAGRVWFRLIPSA